VFVRDVKASLPIRQALKKWWFGLLGKDPEAVIVCFRSGEDALADAMCSEIKRLEPARRLIEISLEDVSAARQKLKHYRVGLAPVLFTPDPKHEALRRTAFRIAPTKILAYNALLERHHLRLSQPIASWLFLRGVPLDRIFLRPQWLVPWRKDRTVRPATHRVLQGRALLGRPKIAILTPYFPYPLSHGGAVRIFNLVCEIAREFDVTLYAFSEGPVDPGPVIGFVFSSVIVPKPRYREPRWSTIKPPEVGEYRSPEMLRLWGSRQADAAQVEYTYLADYGGDVLVEHDVTFDLYNQVRQRRRTVSAWWDWRRWHAFETKVLQRFARLVVMSDKDRAMLNTSRARVIENGVDLARFTPSPEQPGRRLLFIGSFRHFPNIVAFRFLTEQILPLIHDVDLTVVAGPDPWLHWRNFTGTLRPPQHPRIEMLEFVSDVRPLYEQTNVVVVPTLESAGTNVKVLEALAMRRAIVSTPSGCAGLGLEHGSTAWIAESAQGLADGIETLLRDQPIRARIAEGGRAHARAHFDWRAIGRKQRALLREITGDRLTLRSATDADISAIGRIQATSPEAAQWDPRSYLKDDCIVAVSAGEIAGFVVSRQIAPAEREILNLAVSPDQRRKAIGLRLLEAELDRGQCSWFLEVRESNTPAIQLYQSVGFTASGRRQDYYNSPPESAIVMSFLS
jgi:glycosyltransferase involved in cell wall biosynthesis